MSNKNLATKECSHVKIKLKFFDIDQLIFRLKIHLHQFCTLVTFKLLRVKCCINHQQAQLIFTTYTLHRVSKSKYNIWGNQYVNLCSSNVNYQLCSQEID